MTHPNEYHAVALLNALPSMGPRRINLLIERYKSIDEAVRQKNDWGTDSLIEPEVLEKIEGAWESARRQADLDHEFLIRNKVHVYLAHQGPYPDLLRQTSAPPPIIYAMGQGLDGVAPRVALVGSRRCTYYGERVAKQLTTDLVSAGVATISGLARGIDTHVHRATLDVEGQTWAVIGSGLAKIYPPENRSLADRIQQSGSVISEFPVHQDPLPQNFPRRNRVIAGLSLATVLIEGGATSGALITARLAAEEGRDVFAVPNPITSPLSVAPHRMLKEGAGLVESVEDILQELGLQTSGLSGPQAVNGEPLKIPQPYIDVLSLVGGDIIHRDRLAERLKMQASAASSLLVEMEIKGLIKIAAGGFISKS